MNGPRSSLRPLVGHVFDVVAEATVAPSFSRVGIAIRRRLESWKEPPSMHGQVVLVTGATSGIGLATATALSGLGATVHIVGRDPERGRKALEVVTSAGPGGGGLDLVDMADPGAVTALGQRLAKRYDRLDVLIHNAGALSSTYRANKAGIEVTVAAQVLGPYLLTAALATLLRASAPSTIVTVSSGGMYAQRFELDRLESGPEDYDGVRAYARAKRAQLVLADAWAERLGPAGVRSFAMHPGWVDTPGLRTGLPRFRRLWQPLLRSPSEGADTVVWLAAGGSAAQARASDSPAPDHGFFHDRRIRRDSHFPVLHPRHTGDTDALLAWCAARTGVDLDPYYAMLR